MLLPSKSTCAWQLDLYLSTPGLGACNFLALAFPFFISELACTSVMYLFSVILYAALHISLHFIEETSVLSSTSEEATSSATVDRWSSLGLSLPLHHSLRFAADLCRKYWFLIQPVQLFFSTRDGLKRNVIKSCQYRQRRLWWCSTR